MEVRIFNAQREATVDSRRVARLVRAAARRLSIRVSGTMSVTFITSEHMRQLNKRFLRHDRPTDVLSFRYEREPVVGEIVIAPREAKAYARRHGIPYEEELARYVVHGLLHWLGHEDGTAAQRRKMRAMEDRLLRSCEVGLGVAGDASGAPTPPAGDDGDSPARRGRLWGASGSYNELAASSQRRLGRTRRRALHADDWSGF